MLLAPGGAGRVSRWLFGSRVDAVIGSGWAVPLEDSRCSRESCGPVACPPGPEWNAA